MVLGSLVACGSVACRKSKFIELVLIEKTVPKKSNGANASNKNDCKWSR